jgi:hypothetical protein
MTSPFRSPPAPAMVLSSSPGIDTATRDVFCASPASPSAAPSTEGLAKARAAILGVSSEVQEELARSSDGLKSFIFQSMAVATDVARQEGRQANAQGVAYMEQVIAAQAALIKQQQAALDQAKAISDKHMDEAKKAKDELGKRKAEIDELQAQRFIKISRSQHKFEMGEVKSYHGDCDDNVG